MIDPEFVKIRIDGIVQIALVPRRKPETLGMKKPVANDTTPRLVNALASILVCSLCTRFDMFLSIQKATIFQIAFLVKISPLHRRI
jgi:hypothetical protein